MGIIVTGSLTYRAMLAARELEAKGIKTKVMNLSSIVPIDVEAIVSLAKESKAIVTVEEHQVRGGMGSAVAEVLAKIIPRLWNLSGYKIVSVSQARRMN